MLPTTPPQEPALAHSAQPALHTMSFSDAHLHDVFLTHDWQGADGRNHERVARVNCCLQELGLRTWFDERQTGKVQERMAEGLKDSGELVFVTQRYHDKVTCEDQSDNCKFEFDIALAYNQANMLPVVMELDMLNPKKWRRTMRALGTKMFVNLSNIDNLTDDQLLGFVETRLLPQMTWLPESLRKKAESAAAITPRSSSSRSRAPSVAVKFEEELEMDLQVEELGAPVSAPAIHASAELPGMMVGTADQAEGHGYFSSREREESGLLIPDFEPMSDSQASRISYTRNTELEGHSDYVSSVAFSPDGATVASGSGDTTVRLWDAASGALTATLEGHLSPVFSVVFSPDGATVASGSWDDTVRLWDVASGALTAKLEGHSDYVSSVAFSPDGATVASGSEDTTVRLWDAASFALTATLEGHLGWVKSVAFSPDGATVASGNGDATVRLWDVASGALTATLEGHLSPVFSVVFSPDGAKVASGSWDYTVRLWDAASGALTATLEGHSGIVFSVAFSPDGATVASGSGDTTVRLWDGASFALTATLEGHWEGVSSVAFSPDGTTVASGSYDTTVRLWDAASGALTATLGKPSRLSGG
eukprot:jgi/Tetstr1/441986/TSEL_003136.t1